MITLNTNNLYANGYILQFSDGTQKLKRDKLNIIAKVGDHYHPVKPGDRIEQIAWFYYRNSVEGSMFYWFVIADANGIKNPLDLSEYIGKTILVPDIIRVKAEFDI